MSVSVLNKVRNMFGEPISRSIRKRIQKFLVDPNPDTWDDIKGILITEKSTIWQAVIKIDPNCPRKGRTTDIEGNVLKEWETIPTPLTVMRAIKAEVS